MSQVSHCPNPWKVGQRGRMGQQKINPQKQIKLWAIIRYRSTRGWQHGIPAPTAGTGVLSSITWTRTTCLCIHRSAGAITKAAVGITIPRKSISKTTPNVAPPTISLLTEVSATFATENHRLYTAALCGEIPKCEQQFLPLPLHASYFLLWQQSERGIEAVVGGIPFGSYP